LSLIRGGRKKGFKRRKTCGDTRGGKGKGDDVTSITSRLRKAEGKVSTSTERRKLKIGTSVEKGLEAKGRTVRKTALLSSEKGGLLAEKRKKKSILK